MLGDEVYSLRIIEGSLSDTSFLKQVPHKYLMEFNTPNWGRLIEAQLSLPEIQEVQKRMIQHYGEKYPWYADGYLLEDPNVIICAFGIDDAEGGRVFIFDRNNKEALKECMDYGVAQGIPEEQMDFLD